MAKKSKDELARLELEEQIADAIKRSTANLDTFADAQKKIVENYNLIKKINLQIQAIDEEIAELEGKTTEEAKERLEYLVASKSALQQDIKLIITVNKELSNTKNLAKSVLGSMYDWGKTLKSQFLPSITEAFNKFLSLNDLAVQTSVNIGLSGNAMKTMVSSIEDSQMAWGALGYDLESSARIQQNLADETGRQVVLSQQAQQFAANTAKALNMQADELGTLVGQMDQFGLGSELAMSTIVDMRIQSEKMGVNSGKVIKKFQQNLELMNKLNFKDGIKGLQKMSNLSEKYKIEMGSIAAAADKAFRPEGAIEMAAKLQLLGGDIAKLGDPFKLMYEARNNPEKFMEDITQAARASATFDPKTKEFKISANEMDRLREMAEATGISMDELVKTARQGAKVDMFEGMLSGRGLKPEDQAMLAGMMEMTEKGATINGKLVSEMSKTDLAELIQRSSKLEELQKDAMTAQAELNGIKNAIMVAFTDLFKNIDWKKWFGYIKNFVVGLRDFTKSFFDMVGPGGTLATVLALYFGSKVIWPFIQGKIFGSAAAAAFNTETLGGGKKGFFGRIMDKFRGKSEQSVLPPVLDDKKSVLEQVTDVKDQGGDILDKVRGKESGASLGDQSKQIDQVSNSTGKFGGVASISAGQILALGAALLMVGGAIWIVSDAMIRMHESGVGFTEILGVIGAGIAIMIPLVMALGVVGTVTAGPILALGAAFLMIGGAIALAAWGISLLVDSFTNMFSIVSADNIGPLLMLGPALIGVSLGVFALAASLVALGAAYLLGGFLGLIALEEAAADIQTAFKGVDPQGINTAVNAINSIDIDKLNALKELSLWMSMLGATTTIKFDESLHIDGSIELSGEGGGKSNTDWIKDPIFVSKLKELIATQTQKDLNGGKA